MEKNIIIISKDIWVDRYIKILLSCKLFFMKIKVLFFMFNFYLEQLFIFLI